MIRVRPTFLWLEYALLGVVLGAFFYAFIYFFTFKHFPQPFFFDVGDTWMDWFNPAYWAHHPDGAYTTYASIYPPLTFVILRALTYGPCYLGWDGASRDCDVYGVATLHLTYVLAIYLTARTFMKIDRRTALPRSVALSTGLPMLWAIDRGNVILFTYIFLLLAYGPLVKSSWARCLFAGMALNMKVYLLGTVLAQLLHRRWVWTERALLCTVLVYCVSFVLLGSGTPMAIYRNIVDFSSVLQIDNPLGIWMATSLTPLEQLARSTIFPTTLYIGSRNVDLIEFLAPLLTRFGQGMVMLGALACYLRPEVVPRFRMLTLSIGIATFSAEVSGYSWALVLVFCFMERATGVLRRFAIIAAYAICIPGDYNIGWIGPSIQDSYLWKRSIIVEYVLQIGPFIRPLIMISIPVALSLVTIIDVARDIWAGGWGHRWRFRHDVQFLPGLLRPSAPERIG